MRESNNYQLLVISLLATARLCGWIAGTSDGAIQVRDLTLPPSLSFVRLENRLQNRHARNLLSSKFAGLHENKTSIILKFLHGTHMNPPTLVHPPFVQQPTW